MYKIYKTKIIPFTYYSLCYEDAVIIKWFYVFSNQTRVSNIFLGESNKLDLTFSEDENNCIYELSSLQEAEDQLEQLRILESV